MSHTSNQTILVWQDVEKYISRRVPRYYKQSVPLNHSAQSILQDGLQLWYLVTWDTLFSFGTQFTTEVAHRWLNAISNTPVYELVEALKSGAHLLVTGESHDYETFKQSLRASYPFIGAIIAPMRGIIAHWLSTCDTDALNLAYSWFLFLGRLNLPGLSSLEEEALNKYLLIEQNLPEEGFTSDEVHVLENWFPRSLKDMVFLQENHAPEHGPGGTADAGKTMQQKYQSLGHDPRLSMLCRRVYGDMNPYPRPPKVLEERMSQTIFVPKSLGSYRTISMEPASIMWHQKGVRNALMKLLKVRRHVLLRRFQPEFQQPNRDLAFEGSIDGSFATIDLSSASDTVSWNLVKMWFGNTSLYPWLLWTRSTSTLLPNGEVIKLKKFAPMGSDLCFPIETIIFAAIVESAIRECGDDPISSRYRVYGDDIVVEQKYAPSIIARLIQNGFLPNQEKTFIGAQPRGFFRESCGGFYFNGADITPVRISRRFDGYSDLGVDTPGRIESLIELSNDCYNRYPSVRRWCVKQLLTLPRHLQPPFSKDGNIGLFSLEPTNFHLKSKVDQSLQTTVYQFGMTATRKRLKPKEWEDIRYYEYLRITQERQRLTWPKDRVDVFVSPIPRSYWKTSSSSLY